MSYTNAIFFMDYVNGIDTARTTLTGVVFSNPAGTRVMGTKVAHGLITGAVITVSGCTQAYANSAWKITRNDADTFDLDGALWASFNGADVTGDAVPFGGQSWADAWKTLTAGPTAARIAPGDTIKLAKSPNPTSMSQNAQWATVGATFKGANLPAVVAITSSTNATPIVVTKNAHGMINGDVVKIIGHTTNTAANGVWVVANKTDNTFELEGSVGNGIGGASGSFQRVTDRCVVLTTAVTTTINNCEANWTAGTNVTSANVDATIWREYLRSIKIITAAGHNAAGILAKFGLPVSLDLSGRRQVSFCFRNDTSALAAGDIKLKLYSDAACTTEVESFDVPAIASTTKWVNITVDKGSALSATVQGVAVYAAAAQASKTFYIDNIIACNDSTAANSLTLTSLISKNTLAKSTTTDTGADYGSEGWYGIMSIDGRIIVLAGSDQLATPFYEYYHRPYMGVAESVNLYKRETIKTIMGTASGSVVQSGQDSGVDGNPIRFEGGYNTANSTIDGETFFDGQNGLGYGLHWNARSYWVISGISATKYYNGIRMDSGAGFTVDISDTVNCQNVGTASAGVSALTLTLRNSNMNGGEGVSINSNQLLSVSHIGSCCGNSTGVSIYHSPGTISLVKKANGNAASGVSVNFASISTSVTIDLISQISHNQTNGLVLSYGETLVKELAESSYNAAGVSFYQGYRNRILKATALVGNTYAVTEGNVCLDNMIMSGSSSENTSSSINIEANASGDLYLRNFSIAESAKVVVAAAATSARVFITGPDPEYRRYEGGGSLIAQATVRHTESGIAWRIDSTASIVQGGRTLRFPIARIACEANKAVTVSLYMRRTITNNNLSLFIRAGQLPGATLAADLRHTMDAAIDTWQQRTLTFTPTQSGVVEIEVDQCGIIGQAQVGYFDDLSVSQAA